MFGLGLATALIAGIYKLIKKCWQNESNEYDEDEEDESDC